MGDQLIQEEFDGYIKATYDPQPLPGSDQYEHLRGAFFGGVVIGLSLAARGDLSSVRRELMAFLNKAPIANRVIGGRVS